jgi:beta-lactamase class D
LKSFCYRRVFIGAASAALFVSGQLFGESHSEEPTPSQLFEPYSGCALIVTRDRHGESRLEYGPEQCALPLSPCSTFKIPNALIGLQEGVVTGPDHLKPWDGTQHSRTANNRDHSLASAIENSVVWYFQALARDVGADRMQFWLDRLGYGNSDISSGIDRFWLGASLTVTAYEQLELLIALKHQTLPFRPAAQRDVQQMLALPTELPGNLYAKTGSCRGDGAGTSDHGWFIGWVDWNKDSERNPATTFFVVNIMGNDAWGWNARPIAIALLGDHEP